MGLLYTLFLYIYRTAFIYDERMLLHKNIWFPNFVECPERFSATIDKCTTYGLLSRCLIINVSGLSITSFVNSLHFITIHVSYNLHHL